MNTQKVNTYSQGIKKPKSVVSGDLVLSGSYFPRLSGLVINN